MWFEIKLFSIQCDRFSFFQTTCNNLCARMEQVVFRRGRFLCRQSRLVPVVRQWHRRFGPLSLSVGSGRAERRGGWRVWLRDRLLLIRPRCLDTLLDQLQLCWKLDSHCRCSPVLWTVRTHPLGDRSCIPQGADCQDLRLRHILQGSQRSRSPGSGCRAPSTSCSWRCCTFRWHGTASDKTSHTHQRRRHLHRELRSRRPRCRCLECILPLWRDDSHLLRRGRGEGKWEWPTASSSETLFSSLWQNTPCSFLVGQCSYLQRGCQSATHVNQHMKGTFSTFIHVNDKVSWSR